VVGLAPPLVGSPWLQAPENVLVRILLNGKVNRTRGTLMPPWSHFDDQQLASILTYVRREFGNQPTMVDSAAVKGVRAANGGRQDPWTDAELQALNSKPKTE
jgi:mono/diheme cytochrome c family protein